MSYRVRFTTHSGIKGRWARDYTTREDAQRAIDDHVANTGFAYTVEEAPEPGSTAAHHVEILQARVKNLEALVATVAKQADELAEVNKAMSRDLAFALQLGDALREAMRTGEWRAGHDKSMANNAIAGWDRFKPSLAKAPSVPVGASEAPREGGDSDRRRLEALERFAKGKYCESIIWQGDAFWAISEIVAIQAPTLAALADKLAEKEAKP